MWVPVSGLVVLPPRSVELGGDLWTLSLKVILVLNLFQDPYPLA
jgi:hypothetical protein